MTGLTDSQILKKAIKKAVKNGFNLKRYVTACEFDLMNEFAESGLDKELHPLIDWTNRHWALIFSHDWAKHFWGISRFSCNPKGDGCPHWPEQNHQIMNWEDHLQVMVLLSDKEKFKYIEKYL